MYINSTKTKRTFFLGVMLITLISGLVIYNNKLQDTLPETTFDNLGKIIVQQESQLYIKTQEKISTLIGKDVFIPVTDRTFIHITFIAAALIIILVTQGIYVFLIQKEQALALEEQHFLGFLGSSDFQKFKVDAEHLLKSSVNTDVNYTIIKLDIVNFQLIKANYGQDASDRFFKTLAKLLYDLTNNDFDTFTHINAEQFLLLLHYKNIITFEEKKALFDQSLLASLNEFSASNIAISEGRYDIPINETDIIDIFEKVNIAHALAKTNSNPE